MSKMKSVSMALVLAALVCGMMFVGCDTDFSDEGRIRVSTDREDTRYWVRASHDPEVIWSVWDTLSMTFDDITEEGFYTVYYCEQYENEKIDDVNDRFWFSKSVYVTIGEVAEVTIP